MITDISIKSGQVDLFNATNKPNPSKEDKALLKKEFAEHPELWQKIADSSTHIQESIVNSFSDSYLLQESYKLRLTEMRNNLRWSDGMKPASSRRF